MSLIPNRTSCTVQVNFLYTQDVNNLQEKIFIVILVPPTVISLELSLQMKTIGIHLIHYFHFLKDACNLFLHLYIFRKPSVLRMFRVNGKRTHGSRGEDAEGL